MPFVLPALIIYLALFIGPTVASVWISFNKWNGFGPMQWRGLRNYRVLIQDPAFHTAFWNTLLILVVGGGAVFIVSFVIVMLLREMRGRQLVRIVIFFPVMVSGIVLAIIWGFFFSYDGVANTALGSFGIGNVAWLSSDNLFKMIMVGLIWINIGFYTTIILAGVDRIPKYYYEDCALAGATAFQRMRHVVIPLAWDVIAVAAVLWTINALKIFEFIFAFGGTFDETPPTSAWNSALFVYAETFGGKIPPYAFGYASASALVMLASFAVFVVLLRRILRREPVEF